MPIVLASRTGIRGRRADGTMVEGIVPQGDGSTFQWTNCGPACEAERVISQTFNRRPSKGSPWPPTGRSIRAETGDTSGGTTPQQTTSASYREYGVPFATPRIRSATEVKAKLWDAYSVDALVGYGPIDDYKSGSPGFRGNHRIVLVGIRTTSTGAIEVLSADPLYDGRRSGIPLGPRWLPWGVVYRAMGALKVDGVRTMNQVYGFGRAYFIPSLTRIDAPDPMPAPTPVPTAPTSKETDKMIRYAYEVHTGRVMALQKDQPLYANPSTAKRVTRMARAGRVAYIGPVDANWGAVVVGTGVPYSDGETRPTVLYVPRKAGTVEDR